LPSDSFVFEGFLPVKKGRQTLLKKLTTEERTMIFYESPYRLIKTLEHFIEYFGAGRKASVSRELTKLYEETVNGTLEEIVNSFSNREVKGEIVIVVHGKTKEDEEESNDE
jgi:16S rRNA (cytidine1402-2'-O)-methyltransferase